MESVTVPEATTATALIPDFRPDAKTRRYDRQLRLWASAGQRSLEQARVLLVNCDAVGCQSLKNLVLPGISHFTIVSKENTQAKDVGSNFFLTPDMIGKPIAEGAVRLLKELNPAVDGQARVEDIETLLETDPAYILSFTLVIATNLDPLIEAELSDLLWRESKKSTTHSDIPLIAIRTSGFVGRVQIQLNEHCIINTHPDTSHTLRIDAAFPSLEAYASKLKFEGMDSMEHSHVPFVVLLVKALGQWKAEHSGALPTTKDEREAFKAVLKSWRRNGEEENFEEALAQAYKTWSISDIPSDITALVNDQNATSISKESKNFWLLVHALGQFVAQSPTKLLPLSSTLPDMHSSTTSYIALQTLYRDQARADVASYKASLAQTLESVGLPVDAIADEEVESFVKNCHHLKVVRASALHGDLEKELAVVGEDLQNEEPPIGICYQMAIRGAEAFFTLQGRWPGTGPSVERDQAVVLAEIQKIYIGLITADNEESVQNAVSEVVRGAFAPIATTSAFVGGLVAQEAIKLVTSQYVPLDNVTLVDLVRSGLEKYKF